ncbi:succinylglutamic semialdehyde dehydrogenase, partial [Yersinia pestis PY-113]
MSQQRLWQ